MCYHTLLTAGADELARRFGRKADLIGDFSPACRVCAFSHAGHPIVTPDEQLQYFQWGLIPYWTKRSYEIVTIRNQTVNAAAESLFEHPAFRVPIRRKRCLVPVSGFFGWRHERDRKVPFYVTVEDRPLIALAGVFDTWFDRRTNRTLSTYSIITTEANETMRYVNNTSRRMPVILHPGDEERWLDPALTDQQIAGLLKPFPDQAIRRRAVENDFMRKVPGDPSVLISA